MNVQAEVCATPERAEPEERFRVLMIRGLDGDSRAYRELLGELSRYLRGYFKRRIHHAEVEDLVQETLLAVHSKRHTYDRALPFTPWAYAVARYKLTDHYRRNHAPHVPLEDAGELLARESSEESTVRTDLEKLLARLPTRQGSLIQDVKLQGFSVEEAARKRAAPGFLTRVHRHGASQGRRGEPRRDDPRRSRTERCKSKPKGASDDPPAKW
ncbi:MAG: sigma-70 family RNA polymerase sigma factor [Steroidobacteraceae bacterium]